jgi:hypothetical protein
VSFADEHQPQCGHVVSARLSAVLHTFQGYLEADEASERPLMDPATRKFFTHYMELGREAVEEYWATWEPPSVRQTVEAAEWVARDWIR